MVANLMNGAMEVLHDQSLPTIELLQTSFPNSKDVMINISTLLDPKYVFLIYAPILFALNKRVGHRMLIALTLTEWANQVLKWLLAGERPYWYIHERANELAMKNNQTNSLSALATDSFTGIDSYDSAVILAEYNSQQREQEQFQLPQLKQFPVTCELGAGSPSGHAMVTATVWYILIDAYLKGEIQVFNRVNYNREREETSNNSSLVVPANKEESLVSKLSWSIYIIMLLAVSLSRVYLACHFPHQCLCGAILGVLVARFVIERLPMEQLRKYHFVGTTCLMFATALGTYALLRSMGVNPLWSVDKGMRWCVKKEYIHLDTTPFFSMMRYLGFCLGAGLAYNWEKMTPPASINNNNNNKQTIKGKEMLLIRRILVSLVSIAFGQMLLSIPMPKENLQVFYMISFILYTLFSYSIAAPIPKLIKRTFNVKALSSSDKCC